MTKSKPRRPLHDYPSSDSFQRSEVEPVITAVHVVPWTAKSWAVKKGGDHKVSKLFRSKRAAVEFGRRVSSSSGSALYIHNMGGEVEHYSD